MTHQRILDYLDEELVPEYSDAPIATLQVGSSVTNAEEANDFDFVLVEEGKFQQRFYETEVASTKVEVDVWQERMVTSLVEKYYWNPDKLVAELGKFANCNIIHRYNRAEIVDDVIEQTNNIPPEIRLFILSYHLGVLGFQERTHSDNILYNPEWNVISCLAAIEDEYPPSLRSDIIRDLYYPAHEGIASLVGDGLESEPPSGLLEKLSEKAPVSMYPPDSTAPKQTFDLPVYYPQNRLGFEILGIDYSRWVDGELIQYKRRY